MNSRSIPNNDLFLYARSFHKAAKTLAGALGLNTGPFIDPNTYPVVLMYRQAVELHLKALVLGEGRNFLRMKPDPASIDRIHSLHRLAQIVCQIVAAVGWQRSFTCEGVADLADFRVVIDELNAVESGSCVLRYAVVNQSGTTADGNLTFDVRSFVRQMDAVIDLLEATTDALAAAWDFRSEAGEIVVGIDSEPPIQ